MTRYKNNLKMDHRPKCKKQNIKLLEANRGENLGDLVYGNDILDTTQRHDPWKKLKISRT